MDNIPSKILDKAKKYGTVAKIVLAGLVCLAIAPIIFMIVKGFVGLAIAAAIGFVLIQVAPLFATMVEVAVLRAYKAHAAKYPIETLQGLHEDRTVALGKSLDMIELFAAEVGNFESQVEDFKEKYPNKASDFQTDLEKMQKLLEVRREKYRQAKASLATFADKIEEADAYWKMAQAAFKVKKAAGEVKGDALDAIRANTAISSVETNLNLAFAQLDTALLEEEPVRRLDDLSRDAIDVTSLPVGERVR